MRRIGRNIDAFVIAAQLRSNTFITFIAVNCDRIRIAATNQQGNAQRPKVNTAFHINPNIFRLFQDIGELCRECAACRSMRCIGEIGFADADEFHHGGIVFRHHLIECIDILLPIQRDGCFTGAF